MLLIKDSGVLLQVRCHCTSGVGVCGKMLSGQHNTLSWNIFHLRLFFYF